VFIFNFKLCSGYNNEYINIPYTPLQVKLFAKVKSKRFDNAQFDQIKLKKKGLYALKAPLYKDVPVFEHNLDVHPK